MRNILYLIFTLFLLRGFFQLYEGTSWTLSFGSIIVSFLGLFFWINSYVIPKEEKYLSELFGDEYDRYLQAVKKWMFF